MTKIFAITNKETKEFQSYNGRVAWSKYGNARNAFDKSLPFHFDTCNLNFDNHYYKLYSIVELTFCFRHYASGTF